RPKVCAPQAQARIRTHPDASACIPVHPANEVERSKPLGPSTLSPRQLAAARALAAGKRVCDVAADLRVNRTTLLRWRKLMDFTREQICELASAKLRAAATQLPSMKALVGLDGFVDEIIAVVDKRHGHETYDAVPTIERFNVKIAEAIGQSSNYELVVKQMKIGGSGPIM